MDYCHFPELIFRNFTSKVSLSCGETILFNVSETGEAHSNEKADLIKHNLFKCFSELKEFKWKYQQILLCIQIICAASPC